MHIFIETSSTCLGLSVIKKCILLRFSAPNLDQDLVDFTCFTHPQNYFSSSNTYIMQLQSRNRTSFSSLLVSTNNMLKLL